MASDLDFQKSLRQQGFKPNTPTLNRLVAGELSLIPPGTLALDAKQSFWHPFCCNFHAGRELIVDPSWVSSGDPEEESPMVYSPQTGYTAACAACQQAVSETLDHLAATKK